MEVLQQNLMLLDCSAHVIVNLEFWGYKPTFLSNKTDIDYVHGFNF